MLIYQKDRSKQGGVIVAQVSKGFNGDSVSVFEKKLMDIHNRVSIPDIIELKENEILVTGNASVIGNGIMKDYIFSDKLAQPSLSEKKDGENPLVKAYDPDALKETAPRLMTEKYEAKYVPGDHYNTAYEKLKAGRSIVGISGENMMRVAIGNISSLQEKILEKENTMIDAETGDFLVPYEDYKKIANEYIRQKDMLIDYMEINPEPVKSQNMSMEENVNIPSAMTNEDKKEDMVPDNKPGK